jgi:hypothetical protein
MEKKKGKNCDCALGPNPPGGPSNPIPAQPNTLTRAHLTTGARPSGVKHAHVAHSPHYSARPVRHTSSTRTHVATQSTRYARGPPVISSPRDQDNGARGNRGGYRPRSRQCCDPFNHLSRAIKLPDAFSFSPSQFWRKGNFWT